MHLFVGLQAALGSCYLLPATCTPYFTLRSLSDCLPSSLSYTKVVICLSFSKGPTVRDMSLCVS